MQEDTENIQLKFILQNIKYFKSIKKKKKLSYGTYTYIVFYHFSRYISLLKHTIILLFK